MTTASLGRDYFEDLYAKEADPWRFATSDYEHEKYDATLAALPRARYARGLEIGCSIGVLTRRLAARCDRLLATDIAEEPLREARLRSANAPWVKFAAAPPPRMAGGNVRSHPSFGGRLLSEPGGRRPPGGAHPWLAHPPGRPRAGPLDRQNRLSALRRRGLRAAVGKDTSRAPDDASKASRAFSP